MGTSSTRAVLLFVLSGLVAGLAIPEQFSIVDFYSKAVRFCLVAVQD